MTTNGTLLADIAPALADAGLSRVNVSLDSLNHETYRPSPERTASTRSLQGSMHPLTPD